MKGGPQAAMALAFGYLLGRRRKLRMATMMAGGMAVGAVGGIGGIALRRGAKALGNTEMLSKVSPQLGEIADTVRNDLLDAGKAAAMAAVTGRIDSLTDTLHDRAETLRNPVDTATDEVGKTAGRAGKAAGGAGRAATGRLRRRGRPAEDDEAVEAEDEGAPLDEEEEPRARDERDELDEDEEEPRRRGEDDLEDEYDEGYEAEDVADDEEAADPGDEDEPEARPRRSRSARTRSPVSRTRR